MDPKHLALLRLHDACVGLSDEEIESIAEHVEFVHAKAGDVIHSEGTTIDALYLVLHGRLRMSNLMSDGAQHTIRYISSGDQFGALLLVTEEESPVSVEVDETALLARIPREIAAEFAQRFPILRRNLLRKVGLSVRDALIRRSKRSLSKVVTFIHADDHMRRLVAKVASRLAEIGEKIGILCDSNVPPYDSQIPFKSLRDESGDYLDEDDVRSIVSHWADLKRIVIVVDRPHPPEKLVRLVELSDSVFCMSETGDPAPAVNELKGLMNRSPSWKKKMHLVWVLSENEQVAPLVPELDNLVERDFKVQLTDPPSVTRLYSQGIERIVHYLRGVSIGIALSGGAARGMSHLGVLKALEESGITIDIMAGTSAGVLTGVVYCAGYSPDFGIEHFTEDMAPSSIFNMLPMGEEFYMVKQFRTRSWDKMLRKYMHDWRLEQCPVPVHTVTADLVSAEMVVRSKGDAIYALLESINLPVLAAPICRDGRLLVDGGVLNNLPADVLVKLGCNFIIGVDVSANIEHRVGNNFPNTPTENMKSPGAITTLLRCLNVQAHNLSGVGARNADVTIAPDVSKFPMAAFTQTPEMADVGYQTTMEAMPRIREILHHLDHDLFKE